MTWHSSFGAELAGFHAGMFVLGKCDKNGVITTLIWYVGVIEFGMFDAALWALIVTSVMPDVNFSLKPISSCRNWFESPRTLALNFKLSPQALKMQPIPNPKSDFSLKD